MILVTGATGNVGSQVVMQLVDLGIGHRALVHNLSHAERIAGPGVEIVEGDYGDPASMDRAMQNVDHVFLLSPSGPKQLEWEGNVVDAAIRAGVDHLVKLSVFGGGPFTPINLLRWHWESEKYIENCGIPFTHVRPNLYMQDILGFADSIAKEGKFYGCMRNGRMSMIDVRDVATIAVMALTQEGHIDRSYELTGSEALSYYDVAAILSNVLNRPVQYVDLPPADFRKGMLDMGMPDWLADDFINYQNYFANDQGTQTTNWFLRLTGRAPITFDEFVRNYADIFMGRRKMAA